MDGGRGGGGREAGEGAGTGPEGQARLWVSPGDTVPSFSEPSPLKGKTDKWTWYTSEPAKALSAQDLVHPSQALGGLEAGWSPEAWGLRKIPAGMMLAGGGHARWGDSRVRSPAFCLCYLLTGPLSVSASPAPPPASSL